MNEIHVLKRKNKRIETAIFLIAAHHYDMALLHKACLKERTWKDAEKTSDFINSLLKLFGNNIMTTPSECMTPPDEDANKAIEAYSAYAKYRDYGYFDNKLIESFAKWYAGTTWESSMIKCNYPFIEGIYVHLLSLALGDITSEDFHDYFNWLKTAKFPFLTYNQKRVMRSFIVASRKIDEIKKKIERRRREKAGHYLKVLHKDMPQVIEP